MLSTIVLSILISLALAESCSYYESSGCNEWALRCNLPCSIRSTPITVYTEADAPPFVTETANGVPFGFTIELLNYISFVYRIDFQYEYVPFGDLLTSVEGDENSIAASSLTITKERTKQVVFAQYFKSGSTFLVRSDYGGTIVNLASLCGKTVGVQAGSVQEEDVNNQNGQCPGGSKITIVRVKSVADLIGNVTDGTVKVAVGDDATLMYAASQSDDDLMTTGEVYNVQPQGIACNTNNAEFCCALVNAINTFIRDGLYTKLLEKYSFSFQNNGVCPSRLNLRGSTCEPACKIASSTCRALAAE